MTRWLLAVSCSLFPVASQIALACPVCYGDLEPDQARGFFWGIVFLMVLPPALISYIAYHAVVNSKKRALAEDLLSRAESLIQKTS